MTPGSEDLLYWTHDADLLHGAQYLVVYDTGVYQNENGVKCYVQAEYYLYEDETSYATGKETFYNEGNGIRRFIRFRSSSIETILCAPRPSATRRLDMSFHKFFRTEQTKVSLLLCVVGGSAQRLLVS